MSEPLTEIRKLVDEQAEDAGLWFVAQTAPEAYIQMHLRRLHALIEHYTCDTDEQENDSGSS